MLHSAGRQYDLNGNRREWWTRESLNSFDERVSCFLNQYNAYKLMGSQVCPLLIVIHKELRTD